MKLSFLGAEGEGVGVGTVTEAEHSSPRVS